MAETTSLLRMRRGNSSEGSNPSRSATFFIYYYCTLFMYTSVHELDETFMRIALAQANTAFAAKEVPVGAVIVGPNREIISTAFNLRETNQMATAHAEIIAIEKACQATGSWRLSQCTLYVTLEPCFMCAGAIILSRLNRVVYGAHDPKAGAVESLAQVLTDKRLNHQCLVTSSVCEEECSTILKDFFRLRRKH